MAPTQPIKPRLTSATESILFFAVKPNRRSSTSVPDPYGHPNLNIPGLVYLDAADNPVQSANLTPKNTSWNTLPKPARELIDFEPYRQAWITAHGHFSANVVASRGCPYRCNWCAKPISGNKFQIRPARSVAAEIRELKEMYGVQHIWFGDDVFALNHRWVEEFANEVEAMHCILPFKIQSRADLMTHTTVAGLKRAGCAEIWMGVESGSQKVLDAMDKGFSSPILSLLARASPMKASAHATSCNSATPERPGKTFSRR